MKVLLIGSGGREHTLAWKIAQSPLVKKFYVAPGNPGTARLAQNVGIKADNIEALLEFAIDNRIDLTVVGPEQPLAEGIVDLFESQGLKIFGPHKRAAQLESSKAFSKNLMQKYNIPTARYSTFTDYVQASQYLVNQQYPLVLKTDGLAAGKGVIIAKNPEEAEDALQSIMQNNAFGKAGSEVVIEEFLTGEEVSLLAFTDGETVLPLVTSQDHKQAYNKDKGPNTGGMGTYSPTSILAGEDYNNAVQETLVRIVKALKSEGIAYNGVLYAGLMVGETGVKVLEYNCRFGDPEAQVIIPRLKTDLIEIILACLNNNLKDISLEWYEDAAVCVVLASGGYPIKYQKGYEITGLESVNEDILVFHAGTAQESKKLVTAGGRVLGVTALGCDLETAVAKAYAAIEKIKFEGMHYRTDIAQRKEIYN